MIRVIYFLALAVVIFALPNKFEIAVGDYRIANGTDAPQGKYSSQASLLWFRSHLCGATIVTEYYDMTAGHCVYLERDDPFRFEVYVGSVDLDDGNGIRAPVAEIIVHQLYYGFEHYIHDIALLRLTNPLTFNANIQPVRLPEPYQEIDAGALATVVGWGFTYSYGNESKLLKEVDINIVSNADCQAIHYNPVYDFHICGGVTEYDKGQCGLDSGGGMFVDGMQVGIISWYIEPCGVAPYPGVSTKVAHYIDWISEHIKPRQLD